MPRDDEDELEAGVSVTFKGSCKSMRAYVRACVQVYVCVWLGASVRECFVCVGCTRALARFVARG
jgi:hypothetical protein